MSQRMAGEVALVTGSTSGLGKEIARTLAAEGARVVVTGRDAARGEAAAAGARAAGGEAAFVAADLAVESECGALVAAAAERFGGLTVLVNNAVGHGGGRDGPVTEVDAASWAGILAVNLVAPALLCRHAIPHMLAAGHGSIVNVSSRAAERGTPGLAAYTASKGGLNALARSVTIDYARRGVRCNNVQPGYVLHERRDAELTEERLASLHGMHLTRLATAADVAQAVLFLASRESDTITGVTLRVDGGSTAARGRTLG